MRISRICLGWALALALTAAGPAPAMGAWTQGVQAGFLPELDAQIPIPPPHLELGPRDSKAGTLYTRLFVEPDPGNTDGPPSVGVIDIHAPEELTFSTKGLDQCDPAAITNQNRAAALAACDSKQTDALLGEGFATAASATTGAELPPGEVLLFNGTKQNGNPTVLFYATYPIPGLVIIAEMQDSALPGLGTTFHALVSVSRGGPVPDGTPIVDTDFTLSKKYTDEKIAKKAKQAKKKAKQASGKKRQKLTKKAKKLKRKSKKSWVVARCGDGEGTTQVDTTYSFGSGPQTATATQTCS